MDLNRDLFPLCIVWTVLPCISWLIPLIGHVGICDQTGNVYDFLGYHINQKNMAFGRPLKYVKLQIQDPELYQKCLNQANRQYSNRGHDLCCNNCHHHVARVLSLYKYKGKDNWTQIQVWWMCIYNSVYVSKLAILKTYIGFALIALIICLSIAISRSH